MKTIILLLFASTFTFGAAPAFAQAIPRNMFDHLYWESKGNRPNQCYSEAGLSNLGYINDTITHALAVGENYTIPLGGATGPVRAAFIRDRFALDTSRIYEFPGTNVLPANLNGDPWKDYVCWSEEGVVTVLLGTPKIDSFVTAYTLNFGRNEFAGYPWYNQEVVVYDCDSDGYDDILVEVLGANKLLYYRGGKTLDSLPSDSENIFAQQMSIGHIYDTSKMYLVTYNHPRKDSVYIYTIPLGKDFKFKATDSIICNVDSGGADDGGFALADVYGRNIEDIIIGGIDAFVFKGGTTISGTPTFIFHHPSYVPYDLGRIILDAGDISGHGYHYLLFADYEALGDEGAIYLYPIGKGLKDSCVAYAVVPSGFEDYFGVTAIAPGDVNGDGIADVVVGWDAESGDSLRVGGIVVLLGNPSYGDSIKTGIEPQMNIPQLFSLSQNFPNPCMRTSQINFIVNESKFYGKELTITLYDFDGKEREILYHGTADAVEHAIPIDGTTLPAGNYFYELSCNNWHLRKTMTIVR